MHTNNNGFIFDLSKDMQVYNEAYFGKNKNLLEMQMCIENLRVKYADFSKRKMIDVYNDPLFKKFTKLIEDEFGFTSVAFVIDVSSPELFANAFTLPLNGSFGATHPVEDAIVNDYGIKYKKEMNYSIMIVISSYFFFNSQLITSAECLAFILHEIGHNFTYVANGHLVPFNALAKCYTWIQVMQNLRATHNASQILQLLLLTNKRGLKYLHQLSVYKKNTLLDLFLSLSDTIIHLGKPVVDRFFNIAEPFFIMFNQIPAAISNIIFFNPIDFGLSTFVYYDEKFADRFVAMYGYGEELSSVLFKTQEQQISRINGSTKYISSIPIIGHLYALTILMLRFAIFPFIDPHPQDIARALSMAKMLEHDLNDPYIPNSLKLQIRKDLEKINKVIKEKSERKDNDSAGIEVVRLYNQFLMRIFPDGDFRNVIDNYIFKSNDRINDVFNKIKNHQV
jgi:hypothetical protein